MEGHFKEKGMVGHKAQFMALAFTHLTEMFSDLYLHEQTIYFGTLTLDYYNNYEASAWHKAWILDEIGSHFEMKEQLDSASYYYQKAAATLNDTAVLMYRDIITHQTLYKHNTGEPAEDSIQQSHQLLSIAQDEGERLARCWA